MAFQATVVQKKLEEAGFDSKLAYGITSVLERDVVGDIEQRLVTKDYLDARLEAELAKLKFELLKWMAGMIGGSTLAIILTMVRVVK